MRRADARQDYCSLVTPLYAADSCPPDRLFNLAVKFCPTLLSCAVKALTVLHMSVKKQSICNQ